MGMRRNAQRCGLLVTAGALFSALAANSYAWGVAGHETVGAIADQLIAGRRAEVEVRKLLKPGETLESVSNWADCEREGCASLANEDRQFTHMNPQQAHYHYTDVPFQAAAYEEHAVGTSDDDVVHILKQCIEVLKGARGPAANPHNFRPREALLLLVHLMGDVHQPLHVGSAYVSNDNAFVVPASARAVDNVRIFKTNGDNDLIFEARSLHSFWDNRAVTDAMQRAQVRTPTEFAAVLMRSAPNVPIVTGDVTKWPAKWATETLAASKEAHAGLIIEEHEERGRKRERHDAWRVAAPQGYAKTASARAALQLTRAGYRLAAVLEAIWH
ncbi:MAG TPA: S1/P1 nuclease [Steroidobacteraceae bacterium]